MATLTARNVIRTLWNPAQSDIRQGVNVLINRATRHAPVARQLELVTRMPAFAELYADGYDPALDLDELARLPAGTLGHAYARFVRDNGIEPLGELVELDAPANVVEYTFRRAYKLHDIMHVVLDCDASILGEVRIVSYSIGQARGEHGFAAKLALAVLLGHLALRSPTQLRAAVRLSREWLRLGEQAPPYASFRLESMMARPHAEVRALVLPT